MYQQCETWEPTYEEKLELFEAYLLGWDEAERGYPCDPPVGSSTPRECREYNRGWTRKRFDIASKRLNFV